MPARSKYVLLTALVDDWARQSGELVAIILGRLAEYEATGRWGKDALIFENGKTVPRGLLRDCCMALDLPTDALPHQHAEGVVRAALVPKEVIADFCRVHDIRTPPCIGRRYHWASRRATHPGPPPIKMTDDEATQLARGDEHDRNQDAASSMRAQLEAMGLTPTLGGNTPSPRRPLPACEREVARTTPNEPAPSSAGAETRCREWLISLMREGPQKKPKPHYKADAERQFGVGINAFRRAWERAIAETGVTNWGRAGRPPRKSIH